MASILDVAREAHVAASTVSRVINGTATISSKTQQRVHEAIKRVGYQPKVAGRPRKRTRAWQIGVLYTPNMVVSGAMVSTSREWIGGVRQAVVGLDGNLEIFAGAERVDLDTMYLHSVEHDELHGLILIGARPNDGYVADARDRGLPVVVINDRSPDAQFSSVFADHYSGGRQAVEHLMDMGHTRIAIGRLPTGRLWVSDQRAKGTLEGLRGRGLEPVLDRQAAPTFDDLSNFDQGAGEMLDAGATALVCSDYGAVRYLEALDRRGVRVPDDFSIVGFNRVGILPSTGQALTSVEYDKPLMGRLAAKLLMRLIRARGRISHLEVSVPTRLVEGRTTAPVRAC